MEEENSKKVSLDKQPVPPEDRKGIMVGIITRRTMPSKFVAHMEHWRANLPPGLFWSIHYVIGKHYDEARNDCVEAAYRKGVKYLLFIDDDVMVPLDALPKLMAHKTDVVTGVYWMKKFPPQPLIFEKLGDGPIYDFNPGDVLEIEGGGLGCCLVDMKVFDKLEKPYFKCDWTHIDKTGRKFKVPVGEDHYFYIKSKEAGFKILCDTNILCDHYDVKTDNFFPGSEVVREITSRKLKSVGLGGKIGMIDNLRNEEKGKNTIVFYTDTALPFDGSSLEKGALGGSETDIINLARQFKSVGSNVKVFCRCPQEGTYDGVSYFDYKKFSPGMNMDIFISSRSFGIFNESPQAKLKILWMHDMPQDKYQLDKIPNVDVFVALSEFHKKVTAKMFPDIKNKIVVINNGIDTKRFKGTLPRDKKTLIYSSTPFRGLDVLLEIFPEIKKKIPEVQLKVFSGMSIYGMDNSEDIQKIIDKAKKMEGVIYSEPVPQKRLADEMKMSTLLAYPSTFPETFCNTVNEAITAETPVVTTDLGALPEVVGKCGVCIKQKGDWKKKFVKEIVNLLKDDKKYKKYQEECRKRKTSWAIIRDEWLKMMFPDMKKIDPFSSKYWDKLYSNEKKKEINRDSPKRWKQIEEHIGLPESKILDYGCGSGEFLKFLADKEYKNLYAYDISKVALDRTKELVPNVNILKEDILNKKGKMKFDIINLSHVLEHLDNDEKVLKEMINYLNPKGKLIVTVPINDEPFWEHKREYSPETLIKLAQSLDISFNLIQTIGEYMDGSPREEAILILRRDKDV
jgi:glycosyltransferase involved in cell wall biosynthesis/ubiquinone/menaquinone biosynthesis C-methylase UbiE